MYRKGVYILLRVDIENRQVTDHPEGRVVGEVIIGRESPSTAVYIKLDLEKVSPAPVGENEYASGDSPLNMQRASAWHA